MGSFRRNSDVRTFVRTLTGADMFKDSREQPHRAQQGGNFGAEQAYLIDEFPN